MGRSVQTGQSGPGVPTGGRGWCSPEVRSPRVAVPVVRRGAVRGARAWVLAGPAVMAGPAVTVVQRRHGHRAPRSPPPPRRASPRSVDRGLSGLPNPLSHMGVQLAESRPMTGRIISAAFTVGASVSCAVAAFAVPVASARPSDPGVVNYAILGKGSVSNIVGAPMREESLFTQPFQGYFVDIPVCNNWADIGLPEVYNDPDLASFNGAVTQTSANDQAHFAKQAVGVFATNDAAARAFHRVVDRTGGCSGQTTPVHLDDSCTQAM